MHKETKYYIGAYACVGLMTLGTILYMCGQINMENGIARYESNVIHEKEKAELRYNILAQEADYVSVLDAEHRYQEQLRAGQ